MKKIGIFLTALLLSVGAMAEKTDQDGLVWVSASDLDNRKIETDKILSETLKEYVLLDNSIMYCLFRDGWNTTRDVNTYLDDLYNRSPRYANLYTRIYYRLPYAKLPTEVREKMKEGDLHSEYNFYPLEQMKKKYARKHNIKNPKDCEKITDFIHNDLLENY